MFAFYLSIAAVCLIAVVIVKFIKSPETRGAKGETIVARILGRTIDGEQYVIHDLLFSDKNGNSCQIDHVLINKHGIWVIETKNFSGRIYGDARRREWTQVLAYGNEKNKFYNPVKQNATHIYRLAEYLDEKNIFFNVVVFLRRADISRVSAENVFDVRTLSVIKRRDTGLNLTPEQMQNFYEKLIKLQNESRITKKEHIAQIRDKRNKIRSGICPRCGAKLLLRNGKDGCFFECSNYPDCRFTKNLD